MFYHIVNLPFSSVLHNYRSSFIHFTEIIILLTTNYYRAMKSNTPIEIKAHLHFPAIFQTVLIAICVVFSLISLLY